MRNLHQYLQKVGLMSLLRFTAILFTIALTSVACLPTDNAVLTSRGITPQLYGAVGDGIADDSIAFNKALAALEKTGGTLELGSSTYRLDSLLGQDDEYFKAVISVDLAPSVAITIHGTGATIVSSVSVSAPKLGPTLLMIRGGKQVDILGVTFVYSGGSATQVVIGALLDVPNIRVDGCTFKNFWNAVLLKSGISTGPDDRFNPGGIESAIITENSFLTEGGDGRGFARPRVSQWPAQAILTYFFGIKSLQVIGNHFNGCVNSPTSTQACADGLVMSFANGNQITNNTLTNIEIEGVFIVRNSNNSIAYPNVVSNNIFSCGREPGIGIRSDESNSVITNNAITNCQRGILVDTSQHGVFIGYPATGVIIANNSITMPLENRSKESIGIWSRSRDFVIEGNVVRWMASLSGYGSTDSIGIEIPSGAGKGLVRNNIITSAYHKVTVGNSNGTFAPGDYVIGNMSGTIATILSVGSDYFVLDYVVHATNSSVGFFIPGEKITVGADKSATITAIDGSMKLLKGIVIDSSAQVSLDGNRTYNLDTAIYLSYNSATRNGPYEIVSHWSDLDRSILGHTVTSAWGYGTMPPPSLRWVFRRQEQQVLPTDNAWYRLMTGYYSISGVLTITQDNELVLKAQLSYIVGQSTPGQIQVIGNSMRNTPYIDGLRMGTIDEHSPTVGLDIHFTEQSKGVPFIINFDTEASNNFLFFDVSSGQTLPGLVKDVPEPMNLSRWNK